MDHLLLECVMVQGMWRAFPNLFGCQWVLPSKVFEPFLAWKLAMGSKRGRICGGSLLRP